MNYKENYILGVRDHHEVSQTYKYLFSDLPENKAYYQKSIHQTVNMVLKHLESRDTPFTGASVAEVKERFRPIQLELGTEGMSLSAALEELKYLYLDDAISFHDPKYVAHLNCPILIPALAAEVVISSINSSMDTWDQSAGGTFIELKLIEWTLQKMAYPSRGDGIFTSGGTQSNLMGLLLARDHYVKTHYLMDPKMEGLPAAAAKFKILCSEVSHFSLKKNASLLGLGQNSVIPVAVDAQYKMDMEALRATIAQQKALGNIPIAIVGTAGTTDFSSIDPLDEIALVAQQEGLWFHVDAAYGGGLILSGLHRHKLKGLELSDSATIDYHKTFFQPVSSSGFFMRDKKFVDYIKYHADYLNSKEQEEEGIPNMVKKSIQTTRRFDALKLWMTLRVMGSQLLGSYMDDIVALAQDTALLLKEDVDFEVLNMPEISAIVFRYKPEGMPEEAYCALNAYIRKAMFNEGKAILTSTKVNDKVYLKFTLLNPLTSIRDIADTLDILKKHARVYQSKHMLWVEAEDLLDSSKV